MKSKGFTLIELVVYVFVASLIAGTVATFAFQLFDVFIKIRTRSEVLQNGRLAMDRILSEVKYGSAVYASTSDLVNDIGYLSIVTSQGVPTGEDQTYVDFYISSGQLYVKREGQSSEAVTSSRVTITKMKFSRVNTSSTSEGVTVGLGLQENPRASRPTHQVDLTFQSTAAFRGNK